MKRFNINELIKFIIIIGFTFFLFYLLITEKLSLFINPRMKKYIILASIFFIILSLHQFSKIFTIKKKQNKNMIYTYILVLFTLCLSFYSPQTNLNLSILKKKTVSTKFPSKINNESNIKENIEIDKNNIKDKNKYDNNTNINDTDKKNNNDTTKSLNSNTIIFNDKNYFRNLTDISGENGKLNKGKRIIINGFVYKGESFPKNEFIIGKLMIICCAADSQIVGLNCKYPKFKNSFNNKWFKAEGILDYDDDNTPFILVEKLTPISKPKNIYVYPN